jgi:hypothetical protein
MIGFEDLLSLDLSSQLKLFKDVFQFLELRE